MGWSEISALLMVVGVDLLFAADNAIVVAMAAAGLPVDQRKKAILIGIAAAAVLRILFSLVTVQLLQIVGLLVVGGLLLLWVSWKLFRELKEGGMTLPDEDEQEALAASAPTKTLRQATIQIIIADVSMSLDNVLAVAAVARHHTWIMIFGLALSVVLMGVAANYIARLLVKHIWIGWAGLIIILFVAIKMIYEGYGEVVAHFAGA